MWNTGGKNGLKEEMSSILDITNEAAKCHLAAENTDMKLRREILIEVKIGDHQHKNDYLICGKRYICLCKEPITN